jgi:AcrR family transcriptional regulator
MAKKENQRVRLTRQLLKDSLIGLMDRKPIGKITVKEICENAEINRSTFYLYYTDPYALLEDVEAELIEAAREKLRRIGANTDGVQYLTALLSYIEENADIFRTLLCRQGNPAFQEAFIQTSVSHLKGQLALRCSEAVVGYVYHYLIMGVVSMIKRWLEAGLDMPCGELADLIFRLSDGAAARFA